MKAKLRLFLLLSVSLLLVLPVINLMFLEDGPRPQPLRKKLYKTDLFVPMLEKQLLPYGISILPSQAIIGKHGWMFLGDGYVNTVSDRRMGRNAGDDQAGQRIAAAFSYWEEWLAANGVKQFHIQLGPDKGTAYPDYLPDWAQPAPERPADAIFAYAGAYYIDTRPAIASARQRYQQPLYYTYDTHWNALGAWVAFSEYLKILCKAEPVECLDMERVTVKAPEPKKVGGLANFFGLSDVFIDTEYAIDFHDDTGREVEHYDFRTGTFLRRASIDAELGKPGKPVHVKSPYALNPHRMLWLRDSFGTAAVPYMNRMFADVVQVDYRVVSPQELKKLVKEYQPDYVLMTVVERQIRDRFFQEYLPENESFFRRK